MKLHEMVAPRNLNITTIVPKLEFSHHNNNNSDFVETIMLDAIGRQAKTTLVADNILVFGHNPEWNQATALLVRDALKADNYKTDIINVTQFFNMPLEQRKGGDVLYIITCHDVHISPSKLASLKNQTSTQILFKIAGLDWQRGNYGIQLSKSAKLITEALGIQAENAVALGLLASLGTKEFCVNNGRNFTKRIL